MVTPAEREEQFRGTTSCVFRCSAFALLQEVPFAEVVSAKVQTVLIHSKGILFLNYWNCGLESQPVPVCCSLLLLFMFSDD